MGQLQTNFDAAGNVPRSRTKSSTKPLQLIEAAVVASLFLGVVLVPKIAANVFLPSNTRSNILRLGHEII